MTRFILPGTPEYYADLFNRAAAALPTSGNDMLRLRTELSCRAAEIARHADRKRERTRRTLRAFQKGGRP